MSNSPVPAREAFERLRDGNRRFATDVRSIETFLSGVKRGDLVDGQSPFAIVLTCADSRVPAEILFDQGVGDLFVIRVAGNVVAPSLVGSIEYAAAVLGTQLTVVMGHSRCGAVKATLDQIRGRSDVPSDNIKDIVDRIRPSAEEVLRASEGVDEATIMERAVRSNVRASANHLRHASRILEDLVGQGKMSIVGAEYDIGSGNVDFFDIPESLKAA